MNLQRDILERDDSFKKPGAIPFKWEVRPGIPKHLQNHSNPHLLIDNQDRSYSLPTTPQHRRFTPPPRQPPSCFTPPADLRTHSFHSTSRLRSMNYLRVDPPLLTKPDSVSTGCFLAPWFRRRWGKKKKKKNGSSKPKTEPPESEPDYTSELETIARWSMSTRKSRSPLWDSLSSSSFSSHWSSPRPAGDVEWVGLGLF